MTKYIFKKQMSDFKNVPIYIIFFLSVFFQSYLNMYDKYIEYKNRIAYNEHLDYFKQKSISASINADSNNSTGLKENYYIPKQAQFIRRFLRKSPIDSFRLSPSINDVYNRYAIMEGAYPIQVSDKSHYLITTSNDVLSKDCIVLDSKEGVQIVYCP